MLSNKGRDPVERGPGSPGKLRLRRAQDSEIILPAGGVHLGTTAIQSAETRNSKPETNPKHQAGDDPNHYPAGGSWPWIIGHLNLFRVSGFAFRIRDRMALS